MSLILLDLGFFYMFMVFEYFSSKWAKLRQKHKKIHFFCTSDPEIFQIPPETNPFPLRFGLEIYRLEGREYMPSSTKNSNPANK